MFCHCNVIVILQLEDECEEAELEKHLEEDSHTVIDSADTHNSTTSKHLKHNSSNNSASGPRERKHTNNKKSVANGKNHVTNNNKHVISENNSEKRKKDMKNGKFEDEGSIKVSNEEHNWFIIFNIGI